MYSTAVPSHHRPMKIAWRDREYLTVHFIYSLGFIVIKIFSDEPYILIITVQVQEIPLFLITNCGFVINMPEDTLCVNLSQNMTYSESA